MMPKLTFSLGPAAHFRHQHPPVRNPLAAADEQMSLGQRVADTVAVSLGSWPFIIVQSIILALWIALNVWLAIAIHRGGQTHPWDPYPFILLNLMLSFQAAYTGPVVMMSQNRQSEKDRLMAQNDYEINRKAEEEVKVIMEHLVHQDELLIEILNRLESRPTTSPEALQSQLDALQASDRQILDLLQGGQQA